MTDPKAKLQEEIERRRLVWAKNMAEHFERPFEPLLGVVPFNAGANVALELMQAREERLVEALREVRSGIEVAQDWGWQSCLQDAEDLIEATLEEIGLAEGGESGEG